MKALDLVSIDRVPGTIERWCQGSALVLPPRSRNVLVLNGAAAAVWDAVAEPSSGAALVDGLRRARADADEISASAFSDLIDDSISMLVGAGLLVVERAP